MNLILLLTGILNLFPPPDTADRKYYEQSYDCIESEINNNGSFKKAVFSCENAFYQHQLSQEEFDVELNKLEKIVQLYRESVYLTSRRQSDSINETLNLAIFHTLSDTVFCYNDATGYIHFPIRYNFRDPLAKQDWSNMFVSRLLVNNEGNCHSFSYLYKILADQLGAHCWLSLAPNHVYIRNYSEKTGWYNTDLTSASFPTDAWMMTTGYITTQSIKSGMYMDTLSNQQMIALCALDLAKEYEVQTHQYEDGFILKCCDLVLRYHTVNSMALLLKAETLKRIYFKQIQSNDPLSAATYDTMNQLYITLARLGYREMPQNK